MTCGVYAITDLVNGRVYVGSSVNVEARLRRHRLLLRRGEHFCRYLQNAYTLRGDASFTFLLVTPTTPEEMRMVEGALIQSYPPEQRYNRIVDPIRGVLGLRWTMAEETKRKIGAANKGRGHPRSEETRRKIAEAGRGRKHSEATKQKLRDAMRDYPDEARRKISEAKTGQPSKLRGRPLPAETRAKLSVALQGRAISTEARRKIAAAQLGRKRGPMSEETRQKIAVAHRGKTHTPEAIARMRVAHTGATISAQGRQHMGVAQTERRRREREARSS